MNSEIKNRPIPIRRQYGETLGFAKCQAGPVAEGKTQRQGFGNHRRNQGGLTVIEIHDFMYELPHIFGAFFVAHAFLSQLLQNSIRWVSGGGSPVTVEGDGLIETFAWETQAGFALHILNYTNPNLHRGWIRKFYPIAEQKVRMKVPVERRVTGVELLRAETQAPFRVSGDAIEFTIPKVIDYEVAAISTS